MSDVVKFDSNALVASANTLKSLVMGKQFLEAVKSIAPRHLSPDRLARMALTAASRNPRLLQATQGSVLKSVIEASTLGLDCSGLLGQGYLVPYKNGKLSDQMNRPVYEAQFQAGYLGLCDLARRSGEVLDIRAVAVYEGDEFDYEEGLKPFIKHKPLRDPDAIPNGKSIRYVYAVADLKAGLQKQKVMTRGQVEAIRKRSRAANEGPWVTDYEAMALKTVTRQLLKWLPLSPELFQVVSAEEPMDYEIPMGGDVAVVVGAEPEATEPEPPNLGTTRPTLPEKKRTRTRRQTKPKPEEKAVEKPEQPEEAIPETVERRGEFLVAVGEDNRGIFLLGEGDRVYRKVTPEAWDQAAKLKNSPVDFLQDDKGVIFGVEAMQEGE